MDKNTQQDPSISMRLQKASEDLKQLAKDIKTGTVDVHVLVEFREAMNHARHTAYAMEKWIHEEQKAGGNPYSVIGMVVVERIRVLTELTHNLISDVDSGDLSYETPGIKELTRSSSPLEVRLARFVKA